MQAQSQPVTESRHRIDRGDVERLPALRPGFCDECETRITGTAKARHARFCSARCREAWWRKARLRGAQLYQHAVLWRRYRGRKGTPGAGRMGIISRLVDAWISADRRNED